MIRLFIELYLDEDVDLLVSTLINARGFSATTTHAEERLGSTDAQQLDFAASQRKTLLTHNRADFEKLAREYYLGGKTHYGILIARRNSPYEITRRLLLILNHISADEMQNQIRYI